MNSELIFDHTPLVEVIVELERYHPVHFTFADAGLAAQSLSCSFNTTDLQPF